MTPADLELVGRTSEFVPRGRDGNAVIREDLLVVEDDPVREVARDRYLLCVEREGCGERLRQIAVGDRLGPNVGDILKHVPACRAPSDSRTTK